MAVTWTKQQQQAIDLRNRNILVAAAAGSGKTAVLVERIIKMITDKDNPLDIDRLLVVTFTNAAAAQMKERIGAALEKRLNEEPENVHLQRQLTLLNHAKITTIHSFCLYIVRNYFDRLDISPDFRIADEGETKLLKADIMAALLEECFEKQEPAFVRLVESYGGGKSDANIEEYVDKLYRFAEGYPFPEKQLELWYEAAAETSPEQIKQSAWMQCLMRDVKLQAEELMTGYRRAAEVCGEADGPEYYLPMLESDMITVEKLLGAGDYEEVNNILKNLEFVRKPVKRKDAGDPAKKEYVSAVRDGNKAVLNDIQKRYCVDSLEEMSELLEQEREPLQALIALTGEFAARYAGAKKEKNIADFGDLEHFALQILAEEDEDGLKPTDVADDLSSNFEEILIDEYQDSNRLQEIILSSVSRERFGRPNVFMVGDVKQSIYKFRLARPELFLEKYNTYSAEDSDYQKIDLHMNFRSRAEVLGPINYIFSQLMTKKLGNIVYDDAASLHFGAEAYPESENDLSTEVIIVDTGRDALSELDEQSEYRKKELEALAVAARIRQLTDQENGFMVYDRDIDAMRPAQYRDIVILLRSFAGWSETFVNTLAEAGIPAFAESQTGYFDTLEVRTVLDLLSIIDNPLQDIPLAAVLKSPVCGVSDAELAEISALFKNAADEPHGTKEDDSKQSFDINDFEYSAEGLYGACIYYIKNGGNEATVKKLRDFFEMRDEFAKMALYMNLDELLREILRKSGYGWAAAVMPGGKARRANLDMLVQKAAEFESTSYHGLFNFIRYIENLKKYSVDFGEASVIGENDNIVRLTTIHKSKGLEYPIVIVAGLGKKFNMMDGNARIIFEPDLGVAADSVNLETRVRTTTLAKKVLQRQMLISSLGEELRVLYVAMTRAKEKLIMTGCDSNLESRIKKWRQTGSLPDAPIPFTCLYKAGSYMDWILMGLMRHNAMTPVLREFGMETFEGGSMYMPDAGFMVKRVTPKDIIGEAMSENVLSYVKKEELLNWDSSISYDEDAASEIKDRLTYRYHKASELNMHTKLSVSELKINSMDIDEAEIAGWVSEDNVLKTADDSGRLRQLPKFIQGGEQESGAFRGTAMHKIMELIDFAEAGTHRGSDLKAYIRGKKDEFLENGRYDKAVYDCINSRWIEDFFRSDLAGRMAKAAVYGKLYKEHQFVMGIPAGDIGGDYHGDELILIQGIIDAYFEEDGEIVVVDYKTDFIKTGEELTERYSAQMDYYRRALEQITGKKVKQKLFYSFRLGCEVEC